MYYIYQHITLDNIPFYIGKGTVNFNSHSYKGYNRAYSKSNRSKEWNSFAKNGYCVKILEVSKDEQYILKKEETLFSKCDSCVNKQSNKKFNDYTIIKISDELAKLIIQDKIWYISSNGKYFNSQLKELELVDNGRGYLTCKIQFGKIKKNIYIHKLVAQAFILNPLNLPTINHKDRNKYNNNVSNLEWNSYRDNNIHKISKGGYKEKISKAVNQFDLNGNLVKEWKGVKYIILNTVYSRSAIYWAIVNRKPVYNFYWSYK